MKRIPRIVLYAMGGFLLGGCLTLGGYVVDYHNLYGRLPQSLSPGLVQGLHAITPVHYFADSFALILAAVAGLAGWFHDRTIEYSTRLEDQVRARTNELAHSRQRYALAAEGSHDGIWDWDLVTDEVHYSPRWKSMIGCVAGEVGSGPHEWLDRVHPDDIGSVRRSLAEHLDHRTKNLQIEYRLRHRDGTYRWMLARAASLRDPAGRPVRLAGSQADIHAQRTSEEELRHHALHDQLTGLPVRALLIDRLESLLQRSGRMSSRCAVMHLGVDRLRRVNESLGPGVGDDVVRELAGRLQAETARVSKDASPPVPCSVYRFQGDEFVLIVEGAPSRGWLTGLADRLLRAVEIPLEVKGRRMRSSVSIGVALVLPGSPGVEQLLRNAQQAMKHAKLLGGGRVHFSDLHAPTRAAVHVETELIQAIEEGHLRLWYQPIVHLRSQTIAGFEALLRWEHPSRGIIAPGDFVPLAEESGLIAAISRRCLEDVLARLKDWQERFPERKTLSVNLNISPKWLHHPRFEADLVSLLGESGVEPSRLHLEITESGFIDCSDEILDLLDRVKKRGLLIALDDFGTGYSSLSMLHRLPLDILKLDKSFVSRLISHPDVETIARTIIGLARKLRLDVVGEGIQTRAQLDRLRSLRCGYGQGFLFGRPMRAEAAERLLGMGATLPAPAHMATQGSRGPR
jgi:diguanylate cyclase (GGDEF)-like protein/PAS domain S-box-containing protein